MRTTSGSAIFVSVAAILAWNAIVLPLLAEEAQRTDATTGPNSGVGVLMGNVDEAGLLVIGVTLGSPAECAGIRGGDVIVEVNSTSLRNKTIRDVDALIRGPIGSEVRLKIVRESQQEPFILKLKREPLVSSASPSKLPLKPQTVEDRLRDLEKRIQQLELISNSPWRDGDASSNLDRLREIKLPPNPTQDNVRQYVDRILVVSAGQRIFSMNDPQVEMLVAIGSKNLPILVNSFRQNDDVFYSLEATQRLVRPEHKQLILDALPTCHKLVQVVLKQGWAYDARLTLVGELHKWPGMTNRFDAGRYLLPEWIEAVASLRDKSTYADLRAFLIKGANRIYTYRAIKDLPGIELKNAVAEAWQRARLIDYESGGFASVAAEWGHLDALERVFRALDGSSLSQVEGNPREIILRVTEASGTNEELDQWFRKNRHSLVFDEKARQFRVKKAAR